jgi:hypothetical protein
MASRGLVHRVTTPGNYRRETTERLGCIVLGMSMICGVSRLRQRFVHSS